MPLFLGEFSLARKKLSDDMKARSAYYVKFFKKIAQTSALNKRGQVHLRKRGQVHLQPFESQPDSG